MLPEGAPYTYSRYNALVYFPVPLKAQVELTKMDLFPLLSLCALSMQKLESLLPRKLATAPQPRVVSALKLSVDLTLFHNANGENRPHMNLTGVMLKQCCPP